MPVFRLYEGGSQTYQGWDSNPAFPYNSAARGTIKGPDGASAKNEITSIPSPFARIDLVKTAFCEVCKSGNLDGNTIFHKMVSDSLDVGEIFQHWPLRRQGGLYHLRYPKCRWSTDEGWEYQSSLCGRLFR